MSKGFTAVFRRRALVAVAATFVSGVAVPALAASVLDIQHYPQSQAAENGAGDPVTLVNINKHISAQYLLQVAGRSYHLQFAVGTKVALTAEGIQYQLPGEQPRTCAIAVREWRQHARPSKRLPYNPICSGDAFWRDRPDGYRPGVAAHAEMLRSWGSWTEGLINGYKDARAYMGLVGDPVEAGEKQRLVVGESALRRAKIRPDQASTTVRAKKLDIELSGADKSSMLVGHWYPTKHHPSVYVSVVAPSQLTKEVIESHPDRVNSLRANRGSAQRNNLAYLVAMSLDTYTLGWMHGTDHPGVGWSARARVAKDNPRGPDGFRRLPPFVPTGAVSPMELAVTTGTFSGGFQRRHGAFRRGERSKGRKGHHYGFIEDGVVLSTLQPSLATVIGYKDGRIDIRDWAETDDAELPSIRFARQNGVALITGGGPDTEGIPGPLVNSWVGGNWSGSADRELMTPRSAACLIEEDAQRLLVFGYFSGHTPSGMARVLQSYRCDYAIHLDMNSPGQAYFSLFTRLGGELDFRVEHLVAPMAAVDAWVNKKRTPRYLLKSDYRDFFYVKRRPVTVEDSR